MKFFLHNLYIPLVALVDMKKVVWANKSNGQLCVTIPNLIFFLITYLFVSLNMMFR
ncbi:MAG: hypothetical protein US31_C0004G0004 [Berkelbacteria bacterium GW2011_GWA1_36_9]|uniref:Uncharacterized protein n=1 Tax=Berkelbacteria bacterium GW2011_GWA1_36_9 TaxID=1618331 RepID=A0A0G0FKU8_9BACT|nr:MAG: hypothetical protein US31_C0004G0004 [Berkelbacteria bacterium GW2011_GWA1_36_9]